MCDFKGRLIAWMDGELAEPEAAEVDRHIAACAECRARFSEYEAASRGFARYHRAATERATATKTPRGMPRWVPVAAAAAAAVVVVLALLPRSVKQVPAAPMVVQTPDVPHVVQTPAPVAREVSAGPARSIHTHDVAAHRHNNRANYAMAGPAIQIAIPADAMFPPGAVPEGVAYIANLSLAADGSVQGLRLQP